MSHYLTIGVHIRDDVSSFEKNIDLVWFSMNQNGVYNFFVENYLSTYTEDEKDFKKLTSSDFDKPLEDLSHEIRKDLTRLNALEKIMLSKGECEEYLSWKEYVNEKKELRTQIEFIRLMISYQEDWSDDNSIQYFYSYYD